MAVGIAANHAGVSKETISLGTVRVRAAKPERRQTMANYQYLIIGGGMTADAVDGICEVDSTGGSG
jgi:hypothetical protein